MKKSSVIINRCFLIFGIICLLFYLEQGIFVRFGQSLLFLWPLAGAACIGRWWLWKRAWAEGKAHPFPRWVIVTVRICAAAFLCVFVFVESFILREAFSTPPGGLDAIVVLGARVNPDGPSGSLNERIGAALDYLRANPDTLCVASGGQGDDEPMSEAECIRLYLTAAGIDGSRILVEDQSTNTVENLTNSFALLQGRAGTVGIVTNDFHVFRAVQVGKQLGGYELYSVPARSMLFGGIHYSVREFCAVCVSYLRGDMTFA